MVCYRNTLALGTLALALSACGGGGGGGSSGSSGSASGSSAPVTIGTPSETPAATPAPAPATSDSQFQAPLNIAFIGGSITRGVGSSAQGNSYAMLVTNWLRGKFSTVNALNIAVSATNSEFGMYRYERDIGAFKPDIVFIEYAVNDSNASKAHFFRFNDALIYKIRQNNPRARIVYVGSTLPGDETLRRAGARDVRLDWAKEVVEANGGTFIDAGAEIWQKVLAGQSAAMDFFIDGAHPNDRGHAIYAQAVEAALEGVIASGKSVAVNSTRYIAQSRLDTAHMSTRDAVVTSSSCGTISLARRDAGEQSVSYFDQAMSCQNGGSFTVRFTGTSVGVMTLNDGNPNVLDCQVDGGARVTLTQPLNVYINPQMLFHFLSDGTHSMTCNVTGQMVFGEFMISNAVRLNL